MRLEHLHLVHFKNHSGADLSLGPQVNCFLGDMEVERSMCSMALFVFLKAILTQSMLKTLRMMNRLCWFKERRVSKSVSCGVQRGVKKQFKRNDKVYKGSQITSADFPQR